MNLTEYIKSEILDLAHLVASNGLIEVPGPRGEDDPTMRVTSHPMLRMMLKPDTCDAEYLSLYALAEMVREGPKVVRPSAELCRVLQHVDLDLRVRDFAQPFPSMGAVVPGSLLGVERDALAVTLWLPDRGLHVVGILDRGHCMIWSTAGIHSPRTLDENARWRDPHGIGDEMEWTDEACDRCHTLSRIALNLGLLAVEKGVQVRPLDPKVERRRRRSGGDARMARLAAREAQEVVVRDLDLIVRARSTDLGRGDGTGRRQPAHMRRGHWRMQPVGPGRSLRRRLWVAPYWVGLGAGETSPSHITTVLS